MAGERSSFALLWPGAIVHSRPPEPRRVPGTRHVCAGRAGVRPRHGRDGRALTVVGAALLVGAGRDYGLAGVLAGAEPAPPQAFARETARTLVTGLAPSDVDTVNPMDFEEDAS